MSKTTLRGFKSNNIKQFFKSKKEMSEAILNVKREELEDIKQYMKNKLEITQYSFDKYDLEYEEPLTLSFKVLGDYMFKFKLNVESKDDLNSLYNLKDNESVVIKLEDVSIDKNSKEIEVLYTI